MQWALDIDTGQGHQQTRRRHYKIPNPSSGPIDIHNFGVLTPQSTIRASELLREFDSVYACMMSYTPTSSPKTTNTPGAPVTVTRTTSSKDPEVFQVETLNTDTFTFPSTLGQRIGQWWKKDETLTGRVTCSAPFSKLRPLLSSARCLTTI